MKTVVNSLTSTVTYLSNTGRHSSKIEAEKYGGCIGVELDYYCPYCDAPNTAAYTTPVPDGLVNSCDHCNRNIPLFDGNTSNHPKQHFAEDFEKAAERITAFRKLRIAGEQDTKLANRYDQSIMMEPIGLVIGIAIIVGLLPTLATSVAFIAPPLIAIQPVSISVGVIILAVISLLSITVSFKARKWPAITAPDVLSEKDIRNYGHIIDHGRLVDANEEQLYVPPSKTKNNKKEYDYEVELR